MAVDAADVHREAFALHATQFAPKVAGLIRQGLEASDGDYQEARAAQADFREAIAALMTQQQLEILAMPSTSTTVPAGLDSTGDPSFNVAWSFGGQPTVTIPCGRDQRGMPLGLQLIGQTGKDGHLLQHTVWCEQRLS